MQAASGPPGPPTVRVDALVCYTTPGGMGVADMIERQLLQRMDSPAADVLQNRSATHLPLKPAEAGLALPDTGAAKHAVPRPIKAYGLDGLGANHPNFRKLP